jgi:hypothetical protein
MQRAVFVLGILTITAATSLSAHHSYAAYEMAQLLEIEGTLDEFDWRAPHSMLRIISDEGALYIFEWQASGSLQRRGIRSDTLKKGDRVVVAGNPHREFERNRIVNLKSAQRPADGWKWPD